MTVTEERLPSVREGTYVGALDGLRAIAVAAVIVYHFAPSTLSAGFLGVDVFFVVSGFLIARLLVSEVARNGQVSLGNFWGRRARRLLPALATMTVVVCIAAAIDFSAQEIHDVRSHALGTLFYCANWVFIAGNGSYFATVGRPSPFLHMWSLAVEEQFYVVLPLVFFFVRSALVRRPVHVAVVALVGAVASTVWMYALVSPGTDPSRAYLGSDSHAMGLLVGVALGVLAGARQPWEAIGARLRGRESTLKWSFALGAISLIGIVLTMWFADDRTYGLYRGGFLVFSLACGVLIASVVLTPTTPLARFLSMPWLVAIGLRSYSLYLWHWPVRVFIAPRAGLHGFALFAVRLIVSIVLAEISFRLIERPFRTGVVARRSGSRGAVAYFAVLVIVTNVLVASVAAPQPLPSTDFSKWNRLASDPNAQHVDTFGDSTALVFGYNGAVHGKELGIVVGGDAQLGCGIVQTDHYVSDILNKEPDICLGRDDRWRKWLKDDPNAVIVLMSGGWDVLDQSTSFGRFRFGTPEWTNLLRDSVRHVLKLLTEDGRTAHVFEVPCYGTSGPIPDRGDPQRIAAVNAIFEQTAREMAHVKIVHWRELVCPNGRRRETIDGVRMWEDDEVHLSKEGTVVVWKWFLPQVR